MTIVFKAALYVSRQGIWHLTWTNVPSPRGPSTVALTSASTGGKTNVVSIIYVYWTERKLFLLRVRLSLMAFTYSRRKTFAKVFIVLFKRHCSSANTWHTHTGHRRSINDMAYLKCLGLSVMRCVHAQGFFTAWILPWKLYLYYSFPLSNYLHKTCITVSRFADAFIP